MRYILYLLSIILFIFTVSFMKNNTSNLDPRIALGKHLKITACYSQQKYDFCPFGTSVSFPEDTFKSAGISFLIDHQIPKEKLYKILFDIADKLKNDLNSDIILQPYMEKYPFDLENISIQVFFQQKNGERFFHPDMEVSSLSYGFYIFRTLDPENENHYKTEIEEKFDPDKLK